MDLVAEKVLTPLPATLDEADIPPDDWFAVGELDWRAILVHAGPVEGLMYLSTSDSYIKTCCMLRKLMVPTAGGGPQGWPKLADPGVLWPLTCRGRRYDQ